jgi:NADH-quinone oxidoreductase subunit L
MHGGHRLESFLEPIFANSNQIAAKHELSHTTEYALMGLSVGGALIALIFAWKKFSQYEKVEVNETGIGKVLANKWYVDELYEKIIVQPLQSLATFFNQVVEKNIIDGLVNGVGKAINYGSRQIRLLQSGLVGNYILLMVIGMLVLFIIQLFL